MKYCISIIICFSLIVTLASFPVQASNNSQNLGYEFVDQKVGKIRLGQQQERVLSLIKDKPVQFQYEVGKLLYCFYDNYHLRFKDGYLDTIWIDGMEKEDADFASINQKLKLEKVVYPPSINSLLLGTYINKTPPYIGVECVQKDTIENVVVYYMGTTSYVHYYMDSSYQKAQVAQAESEKKQREESSSIL